jgi:hypothetical protein
MDLAGQRPALSPTYTLIAGFFAPARLRYWTPQRCKPVISKHVAHRRVWAELASLSVVLDYLGVLCLPLTVFNHGC